MHRNSRWCRTLQAYGAAFPMCPLSVAPQKTIAKTKKERPPEEISGVQARCDVGAAQIFPAATKGNGYMDIPIFKK